MSAQDDLRTQVRQALRAAGVRQAAAAKQLGVSEKHLSQMLTGRAQLTLHWAERVLSLCGLGLVISVEAEPTP